MHFEGMANISFSLFIFIIAYQITRYCFKIAFKITNKLLKYEIGYVKRGGKEEKRKGTIVTIVTIYIL